MQSLFVVYDLKNLHFFQTDANIEAEDLSLEEGVEKCLNVDDICFGLLTITRFKFLTLASANETQDNGTIKALKLNLVKGCKSKKNIQGLS